MDGRKKRLPDGFADRPGFASGAYTGAIDASFMAGEAPRDQIPNVQIAGGPLQPLRSTNRVTSSKATPVSTRKTASPMITAA